jgi:cytochrome subunit of sulfide dehydrogenase
MIMRKLPYLLMAGLLVSSIEVSVGAPADVTSCATCHGDNGISKKDTVPTIAGLSAPFLEAQMDNYQKAQRPCAKMNDTDMCEIAKKLSADQVKSIAAVFAAQKFVAAKQTPDPALVAKGKSLHQSRCGVCHSAAGGDPADDAGILAGQWQGYLDSTLQSFVAGKRVQPDGMKKKISQLSPDDVHALAAFYASAG